MIPSAPLLVLTLGSIVWCAWGSSGDRNPHFQECRRECEQTQGCRPPNSADLASLNWSCRDNCRYECTQLQRHRREAAGYSPEKFYGHWPFVRVWGMEEPASAVFSVLNAVPHLLHLPFICHWWLGRPLTPRGHYMEPWLMLFPLSGVLAWAASYLFHTKKNIWTTPVDYVGAMLLLSYSVWLALRRTWGPRASPLAVSALFSAGAVATGWQALRILRGAVPFDTHLKISIAVAVLQSVVWVLWGIVGIGGTGSGSPYRLRCVLLQLWFALAAMFEIFDFPPIYMHFDAHSIWHAATVPLGFAWYRFWHLDSYWEERKKGSRKEE